MGPAQPLQHEVEVDTQDRWKIDVITSIDLATSRHNLMPSGNSTAIVALTFLVMSGKNIFPHSQFWLLVKFLARCWHPWGGYIIPSIAPSQRQRIPALLASGSRPVCGVFFLPIGTFPCVLGVSVTQKLHNTTIFYLIEELSHRTSIRWCDWEPKGLEGCNPVTLARYRRTLGCQ